MSRIVALNSKYSNEDKYDSTSEEELMLTREAQETIAESEYIRAINLKLNNNSEACLHLLRELLKTQVLNENIEKRDHTNKKLWMIKYSCHKNIAMILEERQEFNESLQHYIKAILIDNTDVSTLYKLGKLSLQLKALDIAEYAFENCLTRNIQHSLAAEGILKVYTLKRNIVSAYHWAVKVYTQNSECLWSLEIINEIITLMDDNFETIEKMTCPLPKQIKEDLLKLNQENVDKLQYKWLFDSNDTQMKKEENYLNASLKENLEELKPFRIEPDFTWYQLGQFIFTVYTHFKENKRDMLFNFTMEDIIDHKYSKNIMPIDIVSSKIDGNDQDNQNNLNTNEIFNPKSVENICPATIVEGTAINSDGNRHEEMDKAELVILVDNDDSDSNARSDGSEVVPAKPKTKRRCSDLHFLEQWGWHKNRRYSSRKKTEKDEIDNTLNGFLRKVFAKYINKTFSDKWPFQNGSIEEDTNITNNNNLLQSSGHHKDSINEINFDNETSYQLNQLKNKLASSPLDIMELVYNWLKYISTLWKFKLPQNLKNLYPKIFKIYIDNFDLCMWNILDISHFESVFRLCLFYLELDFQNHQSLQWSTVFKQLLLNIGNCLNTIDHSFIYRMRLFYIKYQTHLLTADYENCLLCVQEMLCIFDTIEDNTYCLQLPNCFDFSIDRFILEKLCKDYKRQINMHRIPQLFKDRAWSALFEIIINNFETGTDMYENENWLKDFILQIKLLLQSFWQTSLYIECMLWSEKCLHYTVSYYIQETKTYRQKLLIELINFITSYLEAIILNESFHIVVGLKEDSLARLVQNLIRLLVYHLDGNFDKSNNLGEDLDFKRCWIVLHQILLREENTEPAAVILESSEQDDVNNLIPNSFLLLFTAHEFLGRRQWCTKDNGEMLLYTLDAVAPNIKAPIYDICRDIIYEYIEQITYCLYKYPQKRARSRHLEKHDAVQLKLTWPRAVQIFEIYRPENLPEFNSYKLESISSDMEQLLLKIVGLLPKKYNPTNFTRFITEFIDGELETLPTENSLNRIPYKIDSIFYLLADFYFKNRDFTKAIKYYTLDLTLTTTRFDSWAGVALSKASKIETKLNGLETISIDLLWNECEKVLRCFDSCVKLNQLQTLLWIEYGSFSYSLHSFFSRYLKHNTENLSMDKFSVIEEKKTKMLNISYNCFSFVTTLQNNTCKVTIDLSENSDVNDEKWLCHYMLGKIAEKRKEDPNVYLNHYLMSANYLYESSATYPIKINHSNPTTLSVEALEVFYRINAAIIKYIAHENEISKSHGELFNKVLKNLSTSPFAYNKAKVDGNSINIIKGKLVGKDKLSPNQDDKIQNLDVKENITVVKLNNESQEGRDESAQFSGILRKLSQESAITTNTVISSNSCSSSETWSSSSSDSELNVGDNVNYTEEKLTHKSRPSAGTQRQQTSRSNICSSRKLENIYRLVIQNIEECITRFPEHYKSTYRLIYHYMYSTRNYCDYEKCEQLLLGQYRTTLGNVVNGLFHERKTNNLFNGIWRIPSSEIDRPGSFSAHLVKCVNILIEMLLKRNQYKILIDISLNLYKTPDIDKRYIQDGERKELHQLAIAHCVKILRGLYQNYAEKRSDPEMLDLLIDIYKIYKKCIKYMNSKEAIFAQLLTDVYKLFIQDKVDNIPDNVNFLDLAIKLSVQEIGIQKKEKEKLQQSGGEHQLDVCMYNTHSRTYFLPGLSMRQKMRLPTLTKITGNLQSSGVENIVSSVNLSSEKQTTIQNSITQLSNFQQSSMLKLANSTHINTNANVNFQRMFEEYYTKLVLNERKNMNQSMGQNFATDQNEPGNISSMVNLITDDNIINTNISGNTPITHLTNFERSSVTTSATTIISSGISTTSLTTSSVSSMYLNSSSAKTSFKIKANEKKNCLKSLNHSFQEVNSMGSITSCHQLPSTSYSTPLVAQSQINHLEETVKYSPTSVNSSVSSRMSRTAIDDTKDSKTNFGSINQSPSKTLQEKLAEKQKLYHSAEMAASVTKQSHNYQLQNLQTKQENNSQECIEVIVLD